MKKRDRQRDKVLAKRLARLEAVDITAQEGMRFSNSLSFHQANLHSSPTTIVYTRLD